MLLAYIYSCIAAIFVTKNEVLYFPGDGHIFDGL